MEMPNINASVHKLVSGGSGGEMSLEQEWVCAATLELLPKLTYGPCQAQAWSL